MKLTKFLSIAAAMLALAACEEKVEPGQKPEPDPVPPTPDEITITPETKAFSEEGGSQDVMVTSTAEWTLASEETYDWIEPSVLKGKDGDIVKFTAKENYTGNQLSAVFTFTCGEATAKFTATSESGIINFMTLTSEPNPEFRHNDKAATISLNTNLKPEAITYEVSQQESSWFHVDFKQEAGENQINLVCKLDKNETAQARETVLTINGDRVEPVTVTIKQRPATILDVDKKEFIFTSEGGSVDVTVTANVEYKVEVTEGADWINFNQDTPGVITVSAAASPDKHTGKLTVTETDPYPGDMPVVVEINVSQAPASLVSKAVDMNDFRLKPYWRDKNAKFENFTVELLLRAEDFTNMISTVFGIEGYWLLRFGDQGIEKHHLHLAGNQIKCNYNESKNDYWPGTGIASNRIINDKMKLNKQQWYHLAVTLEHDTSRPSAGSFFYNSIVRIFVDGVEVHSGATTNNPFDFSYVNRTDGAHPFYFGYSWEKGREFNGKMTEIRIWNRALKAEELQAENHFYQVDPKSEGLVAYWKCDRTETQLIDYYYEYPCIPDETGNGYHLIGEGYRDYNWKSGVEPKFVDVNLPEN